ncbi:MAG: protein kinase [Myxococcota bacterium]
MAATGDRIGLYELGDRVGEGTFSDVFRATHLTLGTRHAVKVLSRGAGATATARFVDEARALGVIRHPNVVAVHELVEDRGALAMALELVDGPTLDRWRCAEAPPTRDRLGVFRDLVSGVRELHRFGLVHRDLKPENVLMAKVAGVMVPKVADLGCAKVTAASAAGTRSGVTIGTPKYMAPEQIRDAVSADARADLFSLGVILYELLTDTLPFTSYDLIELHDSICRSWYVRLAERRPAVHPDIARLCERLLRPRPEDRPASAEEVLAALPGDPVGPTLVARSPERRTPSVAPIAVALGTAAVLLGAAWYGRAAPKIVEPVPAVIDLAALESPVFAASTPNEAEVPLPVAASAAVPPLRVDDPTVAPAPQRKFRLFKGRKTRR